MSPVCVGCVVDPDTVPAAFDAGINFFFVTADMHWPIYEPSRQGLARLLARGAGIRDRIVVAAVSYVVAPEFSVGPYSELVDAIPGLGTLDVLVAGGLYGVDVERRMPTLREHRAKRLLGARAIAGTFHERPALVPCAQTGTFDLCFVRFNAKHPGALTDVFPHVVGRKAPIFNFSSTWGYVSEKRCDELGLDPEMWRPEISDHYRLALSQDAIDGLLIAPRVPSHIEGLASAIERGPLDEEEQKHLVHLKRLDLAMRASQPG